jgi:hypothetical protein
VVANPAAAARQAQLSPMTPAPITIKSVVLISAPCAGMTRIRFDGRDPVIPSQPARGLPCVTCGRLYAA